MHTDTQAAPPRADLLEERPGHLPAERPTRACGAEQAAAVAPTTAYDLLNKAIERNMTAEQIGQFMDLAERQQKREAEQGFHRAMVEFKADVQTVIKNARASFAAKDKGKGNERGNQQERVQVEYNFATLGHICEAIVADLAARGIAHHWTPEQPSEGPDACMIIVTATLTHILGHSRSATVKFPADPSGTKNPLQAIGSSMSYAERYSLLAVAGIATKEQGDDDGHAAGTTLQQDGSNGNADGNGKPAAKNSEGKHAIDGPTLANALRAIKNHDYTVDSMLSYYALTEAQKVIARKELNLSKDELP